MECLLISGYPNTGKNHSIVRIAHFLLKIGYLPETGDPIPPKGTGGNFWAVIIHSKSQKRILLNTKSDFVINAEELTKFYQLHISIDIIITSIRDAGPEREAMLSSVQKLAPSNIKELPLARISGRRPDKNSAIDNYLYLIEKIARFILQAIPFEV